MSYWRRPDPPGTINPAKLFEGAGTSSGTLFGASDTLKAPEAPQSSPSTALAAKIPRSVAPPLPRISSDCEPEHDIVVRGYSSHRYIQEEFEDIQVVKYWSPAVKLRHTSHRGHFRSHTQNGVRIRVPVDLGAARDATVVIHRATASIYDAYLLRADIMKNVNNFRRHQIVFSPETKTYTLLIREGRIGLQGIGRQEIVSTDVRVVMSRFRKIFRDNTGLVWTNRYEPPRLMDEKFVFVELEYRGTVARPKEFPNYAMLDVKVNEEVRNLMEDMLYGGPVRQCNGGENPGTSSFSAFSAPYEQLSPWTIFLAFKTLERIWKHLEPGRPIRWKLVLRESSRYRSQIPFCAEYDRPPVISSYHAIFLELKFLHSLWPRQDIANSMIEIHRRGSLQLNAYKALAQPLYQAYSSLRHGFRRLTDTSTSEFRELKNYLENSCHHKHYLTMELKEIYRLFVKTNLPNPYRTRIEAKQGIDVCDEERLLLWHGTPLDSLLGILDLGLQIRRRGSSWTGTMFGNGIYLADASSKSAGFCKHRLWNGEAVLLLCEADVGLPRIRSQHSMYNGHDVIQRSGGLHRCIEGLGKVGPMKWKRPDTTVPYSDTYSGGTLGFNEYVVYDPSHVLIRYLFRVKVTGIS
ncbi:hypothetical protein EPUS_05614 [Endocarpon pusillum Z07020]|uniref:Poly [ADP-ribose] polymerase n=1 Tax=Endocarpon pusillum (strain Z07020 / HMAS-L-300199) TaxID=1263415 RepID=U1HEI6_ENDPU|nr:uncharacterized protein EPUS_05614 [Endocarpon pusillum Z07020]ERF68475.1 hypothetical protein EPUS_05614 [Endocarpon pusillum Z07020]